MSEMTSTGTPSTETASAQTPKTEAPSASAPQSPLLRNVAIGYAVALVVVILIAVAVRGRPSEPLIVRAEHEVAAHQMADARRDAERALRENSKNAAMVDRVVAVALAAGDDDLAKVALYAKVADAPRDYSAHVLLSEIHLREGDRALAEDELRTAIRLDPSAPYLHYQLGRMELADGKELAAAGTLRAEPATSPDYAAAHREASSVLAHIAALRRARAHAAQLAYQDRHHRHRGGHAGAHRGSNAHPKAVAHHSERHGKAIAQRQQHGVKVAAHRPPAFVAAAHVGPRPGGVPSGLSSEARAYLLAMSLDFSFTHALPHGDAYGNLSWQSFGRQLRTLTSQRHPNVALLLRMGSSALQIGDIDAAMEAFRVASRVGTKDWRGPYLYGMTLEVANRYAEAAQFYRTSERRARRPEPLTSLALLEFRLGNLPAAERYAHSAAEIDPAYSPARFLTGMLALLRNDRWRAEDELSATASLAWPPQRTAYFLNRLSASSRGGSTVASDQ